MIEPKSCVQELISMECIDRSVLILYPYGLSNEPILKDNIPKMTKVIREYIKESEMYRKCVDTIPNLIWDSQKYLCKMKLMNIKEKLMNLQRK